MSSKEEEKIIKSALLAAEILIEHNLNDWKIRLGNMYVSIAGTNYPKKEIVYSKRFVKVATRDQFIGVTHHEVAHALLGRGFGHGKEFIDLCKKISPDPLYATESVSIPIGKYILRCSNCNIESGANTRADRYCRPCFDNGKLSKLETSRNEIEVTVW